MRYFDLHCDTVTVCERKGLSLLNNNLHLALSRASFTEYSQVFAIWIPDTLRGDKAVEYFDRVAEFYNLFLKANTEIIVPYYESGSGDGRCRAMLAVEGGSAAGGTIEGLRHLYDCGVRMMTLTWNAENEIASGAGCDGGGLTGFGKEVIREMEALNMTVDVSHLNRKSFFDVCEYADKPFIASHSNPDIADTPSGHRRNLNSEQLTAIKERGGIAGINLYTEFLSKDYSKCDSRAVYRHIEYLAEQGFSDIIALGTDFDGCDIHPALSGIEKMPQLYNDLLNMGIGEDILNAVFYDNAKRFFSGC